MLSCETTAPWYPVLVFLPSSSWLAAFQPNSPACWIFIFLSIGSHDRRFAAVPINVPPPSLPPPAIDPSTHPPTALKRQTPFTTGYTSFPRNYKRVPEGLGLVSAIRRHVLTLCTYNNALCMSMTTNRSFFRTLWVRVAPDDIN
jgi:hypothetical protein